MKIIDRKKSISFINKSRVYLALLLCFSMVLCGCSGQKADQGQGKDTGIAEQDREVTGSGDAGQDRDATGSGDGAQDGETKGSENGAQGREADGSGTDSGEGGNNQDPDSNGNGGNNGSNDSAVLPSIDIDLSETYQTMDGFGAAYTWYGERLLNAKESEKGLDALFSDAKLTILRVKNEYGYHIDGKASNAVTMARNYKEARERAAQYGERVYLLMCCWSPPAYLKSDGSISKGTGTLAKDENGEFVYDKYAEWWVESLKYYMSYGLRFDYLSIQNEVDFGPDDYEGCLFGPKETADKASYAKAYIAVYDALHEEFGDDAPKMLGPESMSCTTTDLLNYTRDILKERPETLEGVAYHLYVGGTGDSDTNTVKPSSFMTNFSGLKNNFSDIKRWQTEYYIGKAIQTSELLYYALTYADMTAYLYWSGVWDDSTPDRFESFHLVEVNNAGKWRLSANYYAMRHYSQFIRPGYIRVEAKASDSGVKVCAFVSPYKNKLAVVIVNNSDREFSYVLNPGDYTVTESSLYLSEFGEECLSEEKCFQNIGAYDASTGIKVPARSVISADLTGYPGNTPVNVPEAAPIVYDNEVITDEKAVAAPTEDVVIVSTSFDAASDVTLFTEMGSSRGKLISDGGPDGKGCMAVTGRSAEWNGIGLSNEYFDHYGYLMKVSYDCMLENGGSISCTPTFTYNGGSWYPSGENDRVVCENMEAGKWYHAEGYMTLYSNMEKGSYRFYWEAPGNMDDFFLDNVEVEILYTQPAGEFVGE